MKHADCDQLDAYMGGWQSAEDRPVFDRHVSQCPSCAEQVRQQERIDDLLAQADEELGTVPAELYQRVSAALELVSRKRFKRYVISSLSAAAVLVGALFGRQWIDPSPLHEKLPTMARAKASPPIQRHSEEPSTPLDWIQTESDPTSPVRVSFRDEEHLIALPVKSNNPNVTIVWIYPTFHLAGESEPTNLQ